MRCGVVVGGRVAVGGVVAAADVSAGEADPQVQPLAAVAQALLATVHGGRELAYPDPIKVSTKVAHPTRLVGTARCAWTNRTAIDPSPTAAAQRLVEPERTSPAAKMPCTLVSSKLSAPAASPVRMKPSAARATASSSHSVHGCAPRKKKRNENGSCSPLLSVTSSSRPSVPCRAAISLRSRTDTP